MNRINIKVGIKTLGQPIISRDKRYNDEGFNVVENLLIGDGFHWQTSISAKLPGDLIIVNHSEDRLNISEADQNITLINILPLETYLECVVGSEMNPGAPKEFLKAHAVISRSWALGKILGLHPEDKEGAMDTKDCLIGWDDTEAHKGFHVCSDDHCQRYQGIQFIPENARDAIRKTSGEVLVSPSGNLVDARFSKCCGGKTELFATCWQPKEMECIESIDDPWCDLSGLNYATTESLLDSILKDYDKATCNYGFRWETKVRKKDIAVRLKECFGKDIGKVMHLEPLHRGASGRIDLLRIHGEKNHIDLGKELWIRRVLSSSHLYSSNFSIEDLGDSVKLKGKGWGHGVGLCQIGAANMAFQGYNYKDILSYYYPGAIIQNYY